MQFGFRTLAFSSEISPGKYVRFLDFCISLNDTSSAIMLSILDLLFLSKFEAGECGFGSESKSKQQAEYCSNMSPY